MKKKNTTSLPAFAAAIALFSIALSVPVFVTLKSRNDSSISDSTRRIAEAAERAHPAPSPFR